MNAEFCSQTVSPGPSASGRVCLVAALDDQSCEGNDVEHLSLTSLGDGFEVVSNKDRLDSIDKRLDLIEGKPRVHTEGLIARARHWYSTNKKIAVPVTLILAVFGWFVPGWFTHYLDHRNDGFNNAVDSRIGNSARLAGMDKELKALDSNMDKVQATLATLQPFIQDLVRREMEGHAALSQQKFELVLPQLAATTKVAKQEKIAIPSHTVAILQQKLLQTNENAPDYWAAASALINYHSSTVVGIFGDLTSLPACTGIYAQQIPATPGRNPKRDGGIVSESMWFVQKDCYWVLDENTPISNMLFIHCLIIYEGGPLSLRDVVFQDCLFDLRVQETPSPGGQRFGRKLLASNLRKVQINSP